MRGLIYHKFGNCAGRFASLGRVEHFEGAVRAVRGMGRVEHFEGAVRTVRGMGRALLYGERLGYAEPGRAVC